MTSSTTRTYRLVLPLVAILYLLSGCKEHTNVGLPDEDNYLPQPKTYAIQLDAPVKLTWPEPTPITSVQSKFDFAKLPVRVFDSISSKPFDIEPEVIKLNWNALPVKDFDINSFPEITARFRTSALAQPEIQKASRPLVKTSKGETVFDFGSPLNNGSVQRLIKAKDGTTIIGIGQRIFRYDGETLAYYKINGLASTIMDMIEDHNGQLWVSTQQTGLFTINFKLGYSRQMTKNEYGGSNLTVGIWEDNDNKIWFTTLPEDYSVPTQREGGALYILDPLTNKMRAINNGMFNNSVTYVLEDRDKNLWLPAAAGGVQILDRKNKKLRYINDKAGLPTWSALTAAQDSTGRMVLLNSNGFFSVIDSARSTITRFTKAQGIVPIFSSRLYIDSRNNTWIGGNLGVYKLDPSHKFLQHYNVASGLNGNSGTNILEDSRHQVLLGNNQGLNLLMKNGKSVRRVGSTKVSTMLQDSHDRIWIGGLENGIEIVDLKTGLSRVYDQTHGLSDNAIQMMIEYNGSVLLSTIKGGIEIIDTSLKKIERIGAKQGIANRDITAIVSDDGNILLGGAGYGIEIVDLKNKNVTTIGPANGLADSSISELRKDRNGSVWFFSMSKGIGILNPQNRTVQYFRPSRFSSFNGGFENNMLMHDSKGNTWFGTSTNNGLFMINARHDSVTQFQRINGLAHNNILSLKEKDGIIYVGTSQGLTLLKQVTENGSERWVTESMKRSKGIVKTVASYNSDLLPKNGDYWWGDDGITIINNPAIKQSDTITPPTYVSGIQVLGIRKIFDAIPATVAGGTDTILTADSFYMGEVTLAQAPGSSTEGLKWDSVNGIYNMPVNLTLPYDQNYFQFYFAQQSMAEQDTTWYRYFFEGVDQKWSARTSNAFSENYANVSPGTYTFKVSSLFAGKWSQPASFTFTILPPWWKTWLAYLAYVVAGLAALRAFVAYRSRALQRENKVLEEKVHLRTDQLQKSIEELKSTQSQLVHAEKMASLGELTAGIAHEIQNPLNFINNFSEINQELLTDMIDELEKGNQAAVKELVSDIVINEQKINHHGQRADAIVKSMLQHSRTNNNALREPTDLNKLTDEYFRLAYHGLRAKDKSFNATLQHSFDENVGKVSVVANDLGRVILNLITNAFYAVNEKKKKEIPGYEPTVTVTTQRINGGVVVKVSDNGGGIPAKVLDKIFQPFFTTKPTGQGTGLGLSLAYDIVRAHGGELKAETKENEGSMFTIEIPAT